MLLGNTISILGPTDMYKVHSKNLLKMVTDHKKPVINNNIESDDDDIELYSENDYFYNSPRIRDKIEQHEVNIDQPPSNEKRSERWNAVFNNVFINDDEYGNTNNTNINNIKYVKR